ncbi:MAG: hypothetical protein A2521_05780 [Deltaproteobacteria bacterium RIFOXYD12_FULL_57_12]|nr:MAG: hypothetical protein A2521_05780 [Deltaproteobacteria bacterium RIFOXYD12_FULL_57_12]
MADSLSTIGIIAGSGQLPLLFARAVRRQGRRVVAVAHEGETSPDLAQEVDAFYWVKLGQLGKILKHFKQEAVRETVLLGSINKVNIFRDVRPDLRGLSLWGKIDSRQDDAILRAVAGELEKDGIRVAPSTEYLPELLFPQGILSKKKPDRGQAEDIRFGWRMARAVGELDIGQCVVVRNRTVLAVEAIEGTDAAIRRGGSLGRDNAVVVKVKKPNQDFRFDLPAVGLTTIATLAEAKAAVLAVEAGHSLLFDQEAVVAAADKAGLVVVGARENPDGSISY